MAQRRCTASHARMPFHLDLAERTGSKETLVWIWSRLADPEEPFLFGFCLHIDNPLKWIAPKLRIFRAEHIHSSIIGELCRVVPRVADEAGKSIATKADCVQLYTYLVGCSGSAWFVDEYHAVYQQHSPAGEHKRLHGTGCTNCC